MKSYDYDVIVIGAGIAGMVSAVTLRALGKRVAVIEKTKVGGNCTNSTCIPSKALIRLSHANRDRERLVRKGLFSAGAEALPGSRVMPHISEVVRRAYEKDLPETFEDIGIDMVAGEATFIDGAAIDVGGQRLRARRFIIATGTKPFIPAIDGIDDVPYLTNETLYHLEDLPESMIIVGGGVDGLEYASAFSGLGVRITLVERAEGLLPVVDGDVAGRLLSILEAEGITLVTGAASLNVKQDDKGISLSLRLSDGTLREIVAEKILMAVGRKPDIEGLSLERAGVRWNSRGITTDSRLRTSASHIYACGDVAGPYQLASTAEAQAIVAAGNAVFPFKQRIDYGSMVSVIFTDPPLAFIGLSEQQARKKFGGGVRVYRSDYAGMRRAMIDLREQGISKIICDRRGRVLGAHILGEAAPEVIHEIQLLMSLKKPLHRLNSVTHAYPTYAQALVGRAGQLAFLDRVAGNVFVRIALALMPGVSNRLHLARGRLAEEKSAATYVTAGSHEVIEDVDTGFALQKSSPEGEKNITGCTIERDIVDGTTLVLRLSGRLDGGSEANLLRSFRNAGAGLRHVIFNCSGLEYIHPEGAGALVVCTALAARKKGSVAACSVPNSCKDVFRLTRLDEAMVVCDDEQAALRAVKSNVSARPSLQQPEGRTVLDGWARSVEGLVIDDIPKDAMNINVNNRKTTSPVKGFGPLWDKRYRLRISGDAPDPKEIISLWRSEFPRFWPPGNRFMPSGGASITPGREAVLNLGLPGGLVVATGLMVIHVDDQSFSFITIEGHMLSGWITFSSFREEGATIVQIHPLFRAGDPLMEMALRFGGAAQEDRFWGDTITNLAARLGVKGELSQRDILIDPSWTWSEFGNIRHNAVARSALYMPLHILTLLARAVRGR